MKMQKNIHGQSVPVSNEEFKVITTIQDNKIVSEKDMNSRDRQLAEKLVSQGVVDKRYKNSTAFYAVGRSKQ